MWSSTCRKRDISDFVLSYRLASRRLTTLADVSDIVIFQVQDPLGVLDDSGSVGGDKELDGLGKTVLAQKGTRLRATELGLGVSTGYSQQTSVLGVVRD